MGSLATFILFCFHQLMRLNRILGVRRSALSEFFFLSAHLFNNRISPWDLLTLNVFLFLALWRLDCGSHLLKAELAGILGVKSNEVYATSWTYSFNFNSRKITSGAPMLYLLTSAPLSAEVMPLLSLPLPSSCPITKVFVVGRGRQSCCVLISSQRGKVRGSGKTSGS